MATATTVSATVTLISDVPATSATSCRRIVQKWPRESARVSPLQEFSFLWRRLIVPDKCADQQRGLENGVMIDGSMTITVLDRIRGHARIRHRLSIPIPNVILTYEWQITRASPRPYLILWCTRIIFFVMYVPLCIMRLHVESYLRLKSRTRESNIFNTYIYIL